MLSEDMNMSSNTPPGGPSGPRDGDLRAQVANSNRTGARIDGVGEEAATAKLAESEREFRSFAIPILRRLALGEAAVCFAIVLFASRTEYHSLSSKISIIAACIGIPACIALTAAHSVASYFGPAGFRFFDSGICRLLSYVLSLVGAVSTTASFAGLLGSIHPLAAMAFGVAAIISLILWSIMYAAIVLEMTDKGETATSETMRRSTQTGVQSSSPTEG